MFIIDKGIYLFLESEAEEMNTRQSFYDVSSFYNKKAVLKCSFKGMRYQVQGVSKEDDEKVLQADG